MSFYRLPHRKGYADGGADSPKQVSFPRGRSGDVRADTAQPQCLIATYAQLLSIRRADARRRCPTIKKKQTRWSAKAEMKMHNRRTTF